MFSAGARASTRRFLSRGGGALLWEYAVVVCRVAACLGPVWGRHGRAAALFWGYERGWIRAPKLASRDATLANTLRPSAKIATSKPHGGGDGPRLAGVVDRRPLQLRVAVVISCDSLASGVSRSRGNTPAATYCSAEPDESHELAFLGMLGAPRVRRPSKPPPPAEEQTPCDSYKRPVPPQAQLAKTEELLTPSRWRSSQCHVVTRRTTPHTEAIRRTYNLIYRKAYALGSRSALPLEPHS